MTCFSGHVVNGFRFRIEDIDEGCRTQNCGVYVVGDIGSELEYVEYYGVLTEILELQYLTGKRVVVFRCRWFDVHDREKGSKVDEFGFTSINFQRILKTDEPFILANQASQVFYAIDNVNKGWHVTVKMQPRDLYETPLHVEVEDNQGGDLSDAYQHEESFNFQSGGATSLNIDNRSLARKDVEPHVVEGPTTRRKRKFG